jgi:hypothetical protein
MIQINLLPHELRPVKRSPIPYLVVFAIFMAALAGMFVVWFGGQQDISAARTKLEYDSEQYRRLADVVEKYQALQNQKLALATKLETINEIARDRIIWSRQLWNLSRLAPKNVWFSQVSLDKKPYQVTRKVINKQTKLVENKVETVQRPILKVSGYVVETETARKDVNPLMDATTLDPEFASLFRLEPSSFRDTEFEDFPVRYFTLDFLITPGGAPE